jgi:hypothetical protein
VDSVQRAYLRRRCQDDHNAAAYILLIILLQCLFLIAYLFFQPLVLYGNCCWGVQFNASQDTPYRPQCGRRALEKEEEEQPQELPTST